MATTECPFCSLVREGLPPYAIYEDDAFLVILDRESLAPSHCMIIPRKHVVRIYDLVDEQYVALFRLARKLALRLGEIAGAKAVGYVAFGSGLPHAHLHLVPHADPDELAHPKPRRLTDAELQKNAERLRPLLEGMHRG